jgi:response regulator RpfG family c-di-GMP phosphodiesterase
MLKRILCVDDEANVLHAFERQFHKQFEIQTALGPVLGLQAIAESGPFAVVVSDLRMPVMDGIEFLTRVRQISPDTVRMMLTGQADLSAAIAAVNRGNIFQFLTKPCPSEMLARALDASLEQHRLLTAERELLEQTLRGSIGVLSDILSLVNPAAFSRGHRICRYVRHMVEKLGIPGQWQYELAAMLSQIGCVTVPPEVLEKDDLAQPLSEEETKILAAQNQVGHDLLAKIPRLENVAQMIAQQRLAWVDRAGDPDPIKIGAHLLRVALDFDSQIIRGASPATVLAQMRARKEYNPAFVAAIEQIQIEEAATEIRVVKVSQLRTGMILNASMLGKNGLVLLAQGHEITESAIARLNTFARTIGICEPVSVRVPNRAPAAGQ